MTSKTLSSSPKSTTRRLLRYLLIFLLGLTSLNALGGGIYGMSGAEGIPIEWLKGSPFDSYFTPSLILFIAIGGSFLLAAISIAVRKLFAERYVIASVIMLYSWLAVQISIIGVVSWLQPAMAIIGLAILLIVSLLRKQIE